MNIVFKSDCVCSKEGPNYCGDRLKQTFDLESCVITPVHGTSFSANLSTHRFENNIYLTEFQLSPCKFEINSSHASDMVGVIFPMAGAEVRTQDGRSQRLVPGQIMIQACGPDEHTIESVSLDRRSRLFMGIPRNVLRNHFPYIDNSDFYGFHNIEVDENTQLLTHTAQTLARLVKSSSEHAAFNILTALESFMGLLTCALYGLPIEQSFDSRLRIFHKQRIKQFVLDNLSNPLNVKTIAGGVRLSASYVYGLFSDEPLSLMKWAWEKRLERCQQDLVSNLAAHRSISEIAFMWGFNDPAHFSHMFHQKFGLSPSAYRKKHTVTTIDQP